MNKKLINRMEFYNMVDKWFTDNQRPYLKIKRKDDCKSPSLEGYAFFDMIHAPDYIKWQSPAYIIIEQECIPIDHIEEFEYDGCNYIIKK
ncbi:MAG: hypothetical protein J6J57_02610 [Alistipes sp.]|nr:hypothetical protein [Alistipes sp.]